jgi:hypothetical protein
MKIAPKPLSAVCSCLLILGIVAARPILAADYYLSSAGDDRRDGTAPERAWRTIARANRQTLGPGDRLLLRGGDTFEGNLFAKVAGTPSAISPVTIGSYGTGKALIKAGDGTGLACENAGGLVIRDLIVLGKDRRTNQGSGVSVLNKLPGGKRLEFVRLENLEASGFGKYGIGVGGQAADNSRSGFRDVRITTCRASGNAVAGIHVYGRHDYYAKTYSNGDVAVIDCVAHDNPGDPNMLDNHSGDGILLHDVERGIIDGCTAYANGSLCRAKGGGPVGIWAWSSRRLIIQNCVSVRNRTGGNYDGGGFDLDGGVSESIMQWNYSAENDGAGFLIFDFGAAPFHLADNVVRFNISENDGRKNGFAGIYVKSLLDPIERLQVYQNTVFVSPSAGQDRPRAAFISRTRDCGFHNNLLIAVGGCALLDIGSDQSRLMIQGNHYWAADGAFLIRQAGKQFSSLADWRNQSGMERLGGKDVGAAGDPLISGTLGTVVTNALKRATLDRYRPSPQSPLRRSGLDLRAHFGIDPGERDFWSNALPRGIPPAVGADAGGGAHPQQQNARTGSD